MAHKMQTIKDSGTGVSGAAEMKLGRFKTRNVDIFVNTTGAATLTVEVTHVGAGVWRTLQTISYDSSTQIIEQFNTTYPEIRAYLNQNRGVPGVEMVVKDA